MSLKEKLLSSLIALALLFSSSAIADIEEIIVTALKRETTLQDTPLAVTVVGAETIEQAAIIDLLDLGNSIPSFKFTQLQQSGQTNFWIRGFANGGNDPGIAPSVATYVDGAPRMRSINVISDLPDIERVEILKGPQSTLFGKNASAGVVNMTTKAPSGESEGLLEITLGNYDATLLKGMLGGAINDTNSYRFAFSRNKRDGYIENVYNDTTLNERDRWALRGQLLSELSDTTEIRLIIEADSLDELCCSTLQIAKSPISLITDSLAENVVSAITDRYDLDNKVANNVDPENKIDNVGATIVFDSELSFADLNAVLSTRSGSMEAQQDADQTSADQLKSQALEYDFDVNTLEVRLSSNDGGRVSWTTGMFYSSEDMKVYRTVVYGPDMAAFMDGNMRFLSAARLGNELGLDGLATGVTLAGVDPSVGMAAAGAAIAAGLPPTTSPTLLGIAGAPALIAQGYLVTVPSPLGGTVDLPLGALIASQRASYFADGGGNLGENFHQKNETFSIYANFDVDLTKQLHLGVGFNYTDNSIEATGAVETNDPFGDLPIADDPLLGELTAFQYFPSYTSWPNADHDGTAEDNAFTHTVKLSYDLTDNMMVYASHSTGFKPKVLSMVYDSATRSVTEADGEDSTSVELGFKTSFEGGFLNIALFDQSIQDYHILQFGGGGFHLANAEEERHTGIEIDSVYALDENLILGFSAAKIEAEYESYTDAPCLDEYYSTAVPSLQALTYETSCLATNGDFTGFTPAGVPELAANLNLNYRWGTGDRGGYARIEFYYESEYALTDGLTKAAASRKQNDINASVGFNMGTASVRIWGRNLTDNSYLLSAAPTPATPGAFFGYRNIPRTYGVTLSNSF